MPLANDAGAIGIVARMAPRGKLLFGHFFASRPDPTEADLRTLDPSASVLLGRFGDLYLINGRWPIIGEVPNWDRTRWSLPLFLKRDPLGMIPDQVVIYDGDDLGKPGVWERRESIPAGLPEDGLMGAGFVEARLKKLIA